jgi:hypothetical protein
MVAPFTYDFFGNAQFIFNLSATVGLNGANKARDVQFIQFALKILARRSPFPELNAAIKSIAVGEPCSGREGDKLVMAIRAYQKCRTGLTADGKVNLVPANTNGKLYTMYAINIDLVLDEGVDYPRVDRVSGCPAIVKQAIKDIFQDLKAD